MQRFKPFPLERVQIAADTSVIAVSAKRCVDIFTDNGGIVWFFKNIRDSIKSEIKYSPNLYSSIDFISTIHGDNLKMDLLVDYTARSGFWFDQDYLSMHGIDQKEYIEAVYNLKKSMRQHNV
ncbi:MAG: hypothetical protein ACE5KT_09160 [Methanosarcinales archaeon]